MGKRAVVSNVEKKKRYVPMLMQASKILPTNSFFMGTHISRRCVGDILSKKKRSSLSLLHAPL
jgi:hypothetical protein